MPRKHTKESFIAKARLKHGDAVDYSLVEYVNNSTLVKILCPTHGEVLTHPNRHLLSSQPCPKCGRDAGNGLKISRETFLKRACTKFKNKFDLSEIGPTIQYKGRGSKVSIGCPIHGKFLSIPEDFIDSLHGCQKCADAAIGDSQRESAKFFEKCKQMHGDKFEYSQTRYQNTSSKVVIVCKKHGEFLCTPSNHLKEFGGCKYCWGRVFDRETFIAKATEVHGSSYDYSKVQYVTSSTHVEVGCPLHGGFPITPNNHLRGKRCPQCLAFRSKNETLLYDTIKAEFPVLKLENNYRGLREIDNLEIDIAIPELKLYIEWNGAFWHSRKFMQDNDSFKKSVLGENLIQVIDKRSYNPKFVEKVFNTQIKPEITRRLQNGTNKNRFEN